MKRSVYIILLLACLGFGGWWFSNSQSNVRDAIDQYYADKGKYPEALSTLVSEHYLRAIPKDPITQSPDTWQTTPAEPDAGSVASAAGIYNVTSGAPDTALDGSRYSDW